MPQPTTSASPGRTAGPLRRDWLEDPRATLGSTLLVPMVDWRRLDLQRQDALGGQARTARQLRRLLNGVALQRSLAAG